jgi:hypothetical protein
MQKKAILGWIFIIKAHSQRYSLIHASHETTRRHTQQKETYVVLHHISNPKGRVFTYVTS